MKKLLIKATIISGAIILLSSCGCTNTSNTATLGGGTSIVESSTSRKSKIAPEVSKEVSKTESSKEVSKIKEVSKLTESSVEEVESSIEEYENYNDYSLTIVPDDYDYAAVPSVESEEEIIYEYNYQYPTYYTPDEFYNMGIIEWGGWSWTYYSEVYMPGVELSIPGRWTDENGYICDEDNYICLASSSLPKGTIVDTPFGKMGKVYDCGCLNYILDVYVSWY